MIKICIVGGIGSGKSFVAKLFGYPVFNADKEVLKIYKRNRNCFNKLRKKLPKFITSFPIKKNQLKAAVLEKKNNLKKIESTVHPIVQKNLKKFIKFNKNKKILVFDIPLILENKNVKKNYIIVFVDAKKRDIDKKLKERKNYNKDILKKLAKAQLPLEIKRKKAHYIIKNNFKKKTLIKNVKILLKKILK